MADQDLPEDFLALLRSVTALRPRRVIDHILEKGFVTTEELKDEYGYNHPPRAARDVREQGVPLETFRVTASDGRKIGAYKFGNPTQVRRDQLAGRRTFSKEFKHKLIAEHDSRCAICNAEYEDRYLQIDHRVPYEVAGDEASLDRNPDAYMPLCGTDNRAKSWSCERCDNWSGRRDYSVCETCYWAHPENYTHVAMRRERRVDIVWHGDEVAEFDALMDRFQGHGESPAARIKRMITGSSD